MFASQHSHLQNTLALSNWQERWKAMPHSSFSLYSHKFQRFNCTKFDIAKQSEAFLKQLATFMAMVIEKSNPLTVDLLRQSNNMSRKYSKGAKFKMHTCT